jgi:hypothetical protein
MMQKLLKVGVEDTLTIAIAVGEIDWLHLRDANVNAIGSLRWIVIGLGRGPRMGAVTTLRYPAEFNAAQP